MASVKRQLDLRTSPQSSLLYIPDLIPLDSPPQVRCPKIQKKLKAVNKGRKFVAKQIEVLESAFDINQYPTPQRYEALALALGVEIKKVQTWFKNARAKKRQMIRLKETAHTEQQLQRWRRRAELRRSLNSTPAATTHPTQSGNSVLASTDPKLIHIQKDLVLPEQMFVANEQTSHTVQRDRARINLFGSQAQPSLRTPNYVQVTPATRPRWGCYAPVQDFPPNVFAAKEETAVSQSTSAFFDSALRRLLTPDIFNTMVFDQRLI